MKSLVFLVMTGAAMTLLSSCNGILSDMYDSAEPTEDSDFGFSNVTTPGEPARLYIDATAYDKWTYIDFHTLKTTTLSVDEPAPQQWDIAVHRYDAKTNDGAVSETGATSFAGDLSIIEPFAKDIFTTNQIACDMSTMMDGYITYTESDYNATLSRWLDVDTSTMPPIYTPSNKVYIVQLKDGSYVALRLVSFMDSSGVKGFLDIEYKYPYTI